MAKAGNHFAELDAAAESLAGELGDDPSALQAGIRARLKERHGMAVQIVREDVLAGTLRHYAMHRRRLLLSERLASSGRLFAVAYTPCAQELADASATQLARGGAPRHANTRRTGSTITHKT